MDHTPEVPDHVPPSEEVQYEEFLVEHRVLVRREKFKLHATWWGIASGFAVLISFLYVMQAYWLMMLVAMLAASMLAYTNTRVADDTYRSGVKIGMALASLSAMGSYMHGLAHLQHGEPPCDDSLKIRLPKTLPHLWEDEMCRDEIDHALSDDDDEDQQFNHRPRP